MNRTVIVCSSNRPIQDQTRYNIDALIKAGAYPIWQKGSADVAYARNTALSMALRSITTWNRQRSEVAADRDKNPHGDAPTLFDTVLMVDDDMAFTLEQAQELVSASRESGVPASAMYATMMGTLAATRLYTPPGNPQRWLVGLGLLAIPFALLQEVAKRSEQFEAHGVEHVEFTWTAAYDGVWCAEDYTLCRRLGGVHLLPIAVGHVKLMPIYPDEETVHLIATGGRLPGDTDAKVLQRIEEPAMLEALRSKK